MAGPFPGAPDNLDLHMTDGGTVYQFLADHRRWVLYKNLDANTFVEVAGDTMTGELLVEADIKARDGGDLYAYSAGNDKNVNIMHNDADGYYTVSSGNAIFRVPDAKVFDMSINNVLKTRLNANAFEPGATDAMDLGGAARNWDEIFVNTVTEGCEALPDDPPDWKEKLPEFLTKTINIPIYEQYTEINKDGELEGKERIIRHEDKTFINVGMVARLALREVELLKIEIEALKKTVGPS